jgi:hypothetical protein
MWWSWWEDGRFRRKGVKPGEMESFFHRSNIENSTGNLDANVSIDLIAKIERVIDFHLCQFICGYCHNKDQVLEATLVHFPCLQSIHPPHFHLIHSP